MPTIHTHSDIAIGGVLRANGSTGNTSTAWPVANLSVLVPFVVPYTITVRELMWYSGATATGNIDLGIYGADASTLVASMGGFVYNGGTSQQRQTTTFTDKVLTPGLYYMAISLSSTSGTVGAVANGNALVFAAAGVLQATSNYPLATGITPTAMAQTVLPFFGLMLEGTAV